jgi:hypothetical protein
MIVNTRSVPMAAAWLPSAGRIMPVPPVRPAIRHLQEQDAFFSPHSSRAKINGFLNNSPDNAHLIFNFQPAPPSLLSTILGRKHPMALVARKWREHALQPQSLEEGRDPAAPHSAGMAIEWIHYEPITNPTLLVQASKLNLLPPLPGEPIRENPVAFIPKTGTLLSAALMAQAGIQEKTRFLGEKLAKWLSQVVPEGKFSWVSVTPEGILTLFDRWKLNLVRYWRDSQGNKVQVLNLAQLPYGMTVNVHKREPLKTFVSTTGFFKKILKAEILSAMERAERQGHQLIPDPIFQEAAQKELDLGLPTAKIPAITPGASEIPNPFAIEPTSVFNAFTHP